MKTNEVDDALAWFDEIGNEIAKLSGYQRGKVLAAEVRRLREAAERGVPVAWISDDDMDDLRRGCSAFVRPIQTKPSQKPLYAPQMSPWRPIESAPMRTPILVTDGRYWAVMKRGEPSYPGDSGFAAHGHGGHDWEYYFDEDKLTHWMPLPPPPQSGAA